MGKPHGINQWIELLQPLMGDEAMQRYQEMLSGSTILLPVEVFGAKTHYLKQVDQEILDFGMERSSFDEGAVRGLKKGSRAEEAGLRDGDKIVRSSYIWRCEYLFERSSSLQKQNADYSIQVWITLRSSWK
jgi:predicted metalloprotease with PDZ domain